MPTNNDPLYIGATNWGNLQQQYTPYQLSQATTRQWNTNTGQYDIYWNPAVNIANIPREMQVPTNTGNVTPSNGSTTTISGGSSGNVQDQIMSMFGSGQASGYDAMSMLMQQRDAMLNQQQQQQQGLYDQYNTQLDSALNRNMWGEYQTELQRQGYDEKLGLLNNYNAQLRDLTLDYQMGRQAIKRESRLESMTKGRMSNIYEQYANEATLINNNIAGVQGQLDRIEKNTEKFFDFLQIQNQNVIDNLTSLRDMAGQNIISLSKEERESIDTRLSIVQNQLESNERERDAKRQLIMEAYQSGLDLSAMGVNLADDYETLMSKIGPAYRTEMLRQEAIAKSGNGSSSSSTSMTDQELQATGIVVQGADGKWGVDPAVLQLYTSQGKDMRTLFSAANNLADRLNASIVPQSQQQTQTQPKIKRTPVQSGVQARNVAKYLPESFLETGSAPIRAGIKGVMNAGDWISGFLFGK